jgi:hypothetical protein
MPKPHVSLDVPNVERSVAFYIRFFVVEAFAAGKGCCG